METIEQNKSAEEVLVESAVAERIEVQDEFLSPYRLAKLTSELVGYEVKPQMIYQYVRQNLIAATRNELGKWQVSRTDAEKFLNKYVPKHRI